MKSQHSEISRFTFKQIEKSQAMKLLAFDSLSNSSVIKIIDHILLFIDKKLSKKVQTDLEKNNAPMQLNFFEW